MIILAKIRSSCIGARLETCYFIERLFWKHSTHVFVSFFMMNHCAQYIVKLLCRRDNTSVTSCSCRFNFWVSLSLVALKLFITVSAYSFVSLVVREQFAFPCPLPCVGRRNRNWASGRKQMTKNEKGSRSTRSPRTAETTAKKQK